MKRQSRTNQGITSAGMLALIVCSAHAASTTDNFGSFSIDFVDIGNPGNLLDVSNQYGGVSYTYRMGFTEVPQEAIAKATESGLANVTAGAWTGLRPAANMTWYEAAAFVNWLNTSTGHHAAYQLDAANTSLTPWDNPDAWQLDGPNPYRHKDAYYFLPSENEWYKAAYHQNDGVTGNYWIFATGSNFGPTPVASGTDPGTAVYGAVTSLPAEVNLAGGLSPYGTMGQNGNVYEWTESASWAPNDDPAEARTIRGGFWAFGGADLYSSYRPPWDPATEVSHVGFRVASVAVVPEPGTALLLGIGCIGIAATRRRAAAL